MRFTKRQLGGTIATVLLAAFLLFYKLPYYVYKPGSADALDPIVQVEGGYESAGDMHLVTVRGGQANPIQYILAKVLPHQEIMPLENVRPKGVSEEEYFHAQLQMMESSQEASIVVAYQAADKKIEIDYQGVYVVSVVDNMPAEGKLQSGDRIVGADGHKVKESGDLIDYVETKKAGETISLDVIRDDKRITEKVKLDTFSDNDKKVGMGIQLVTDRNVSVEPEVNFSSGNIGGPSAGLMFALEIYDQLTEVDLTNGLQIAGTGEVDYDGNVHRIGGIDKKVIAADKEGCAIFFAPNEGGRKDSNYEVARKTAEEIGTKMKVVPVDTFYDALHYLEKLANEK